MTAITVYTKPACVQCNATFRALDKQVWITRKSTSPSTATLATT